MKNAWSLIVLLFATTAAAEPAITITSLFPWEPGNYNGYISGRVTGLTDPSQFVVAPLSYVDGGGWTSKPYWENGSYHPYVPINADGTWTALVTTGGLDPVATGFVAALYPKTAVIPSVGGLVAPPVESSLAWTYAPRYYGTTIQWSQQEWMVKTSCTANMGFIVGPGSNRFTDDPDYVWKDASERIHIKLQKNNGNIPLGGYPSGDGNFYGGELFTKNGDFGYGVYTIETANFADDLPANVVQGSMFTWCELGNGGSNPNKEVDTAEMGRWGNPADPGNIQHVPQPYTHDGNIHRFTAPNEVLVSTMDWKPTYICLGSA